MSESLNPALIDLARWSIGKKQYLEKESFVPTAPPQDPAAMGGAPPGMPADPAAMGGMPADPSMAGAPMPTGDPAAMAGAPGMMPPPEESLAPPPQPMTPEMITQAVVAAMQQGGGKLGGKTGNKQQDMALMSQDVFQTKRMLLHLYSAMGLSLPPDILDDPSRDPVTGAAGAGPQVGPVPIQPGAAGTPTPPAAGAQKTAADILESIGLPSSSMAQHPVSTQASAVALVTKRLASHKSK